MPSRFESLSLVLLEAWNHGLPAVVNAHCSVLKGQALRANGALYYRNYDEFARVCHRAARAARSWRATLGQQGLAYVDREYRWPTVIAQNRRAADAGCWQALRLDTVFLSRIVLGGRGSPRCDREYAVCSRRPRAPRSPPSFQSWSLRCRASRRPPTARPAAPTGIRI